MYWSAVFLFLGSGIFSGGTDRCIGQVYWSSMGFGIFVFRQVVPVGVLVRCIGPLWGSGGVLVRGIFVFRQGRGDVKIKTSKTVTNSKA